MDFATFAHDLRTPLHVILGHVQMLRVEPLSDIAGHRLDNMETQVRRIVKLLESWADPPRRGGSGLVDVSDTIRNAVDELELMLERRQIELRLRLDPALPPIAGDGDALHRVLANVIVNAADSIRVNGRITIVAHSQALPRAAIPAVHVEVRDTGAGIPAELLPRIFDYGFTTKPLGQGTGLGLWICREIVQTHGGRIDVSSEQGKGTTVRLMLPTSA
jgi:two-component system, NtrC family, sensor kinase